MLVHREERSLGLDIHLSMSLQENRHEDRIADPSIGEPSSLILRSTYPHCPKACKGQSMTWDTPTSTDQTQPKKKKKLGVPITKPIPFMSHLMVEFDK